MTALIALLVILAVFGGIGYFANILAYALIVGVIVWAVGFVVGGTNTGEMTETSRRRWYYW